MDTSRYVMPFGKYKGKELRYIMMVDSQYLCWFVQNVNECVDIKDQIVHLNGWDFAVDIYRQQKGAEQAVREARKKQRQVDREARRAERETREQRRAAARKVPAPDMIADEMDSLIEQLMLGERTKRLEREERNRQKMLAKGGA